MTRAELPRRNKIRNETREELMRLIDPTETSNAIWRWEAADRIVTSLEKGQLTHAHSTNQIKKGGVD